MKSTKKDNITKYKFLFSIMILLIYMIGRSIPIIGVDVAAYNSMSISSENVLLQTIGGDAFRYSVFALGISPYVMSSLIVTMVISFIFADSNKMTPQRVHRVIAMGFLGFAIFQAYQRTNELIFVDGEMQSFIKLLAGMELVFGAMIIIFLAGRNKKYGIGGQTLLILVNIVDGILRQAIAAPFEEIVIPVIIGIGLLLVTLLAENTEKRMTLLRIGVDCVGREKTYQAYKFNPVGVMPIMFASAAYQLICALTVVAHNRVVDNEIVNYIFSHQSLSNWMGIGIYVFSIFLLTYLFSFITIDPKKLAKQLQRNGDCVEGVHPGKETRRYLCRSLFFMDTVSATLLSVAIAIPLYLQMKGMVSSTYAMLPTSFMMLVGIFHNVYEEYRTIKSYSEYYPFL